jgi:pimeloyl-ACP methyl ester carboxylesterase
VLERGDVLVLEDGPLNARIAGARRRRSAFRDAAAAVAFEVPVKPLGRSQVVDAVRALDDKLTPRLGLFEVQRDGTLGANAAGVLKRGRVLLWIHGTFSHSEAILKQLIQPGNAAGQELLSNALRHYDQVLAFNHRTLSVSPMLNARELALRLRGSEAEVDVICHSRGGLVARWFAEVFDPPRPGRDRRVVFVASPLQGTSLADPKSLKSALSLALNIQKGLVAAGELAEVAFPFVAFATGFFRVTAALTGAFTGTPLVDAAVAIVPGLRAMSRIEDNFELESLRNEIPHPNADFFNRHYFAVQSDFQPSSEKVGWRFWRAFRNLGGRIGERVVEPVFEAANDLVVDTTSMTSFVDAKRMRIDPNRVKDFGVSREIHHTSYFRSAETTDFVRRALGF